MSEVLTIIQNGTPVKQESTVKHKKSIEAFKSYLLVARAENKAFEPRNW